MIRLVGPTRWRETPGRWQDGPVLKSGLVYFIVQLHTCWRDCSMQLVDAMFKNGER